MRPSMMMFIWPVCCWLLLVKDFIIGIIPFNMDTNTIYAVAKFYFNNLFNGVVPLWDPFVSLGHPFYALSICNLFNPLTLLVPLLKICGASYNVAFAVYMSAYFWVGCLGFYLLAREVLKDKGLAYLAYIGLLFSSLGLSIFTQFTFVEIVTPVIWFFYFLAAHYRCQSVGHLLGITASLMAVLTAYLPFYFLTVLFVFIVLALILYPASVLDYCRRSFSFKLRHWPWTLACLVGVIVAAGPLLAYKMLDASGESVSPGRHCQYSSAQDCYDRTLGQQGGMLYEEIARSGGLGERLDLGYLFTHLDKMTYGSDSLLFVPALCYLLVLLSLFLRCDRLNVMLVGMMTAIGLIGLGSAGPLHRFLFDHVFFFKYFRNLFFLGAFLVPLFILYSVKQLGVLLAWRPENATKRKLAVTALLLAHAGAGLYLHYLGGIVPALWVTLALSAVSFTCYFTAGYTWGEDFWKWVFALLMVVQPIKLMADYTANAVEFHCDLPSAQVTPKFGWIRPDKPAASTCRIYQFVPYEDFWYAMSMEDAPAIVGYPQAASRWAFMLSKQLGDAALANYAKYKVYLYDDMTSPGQVQTGPSGAVNVRHFDVNRVVFNVNLPKRKLFVYNDAFTQHWHAAIDGNPVELLRCSGAFKGVWVGAGQHTIDFSYHPPGGQWVYILTAVIMVAFFSLTAIMVKLKR